MVFIRSHSRLLSGILTLVFILGIYLMTMPPDILPAALLFLIPAGP